MGDKDIVKKRIGISYSEANLQNYWNWFTPEDLGDDVELVNLSFVANNIEEMKTCVGFVLTGGIDVLPAIYGGAEVYPHRPEFFLPERDEFERKIYIYSQQHKIPVLGICRGMQYLNILEGGTVLEDMGEQMNGIHKRDEADKTHGVVIEKDSLLSAIAGIASGVVNSAHHQAVMPGHLAQSLMVSAFSATGSPIIEALEFKDKTRNLFMLGVQWHPERMKEKESNPLSRKIKERFITEVRNYPAHLSDRI